MPSPWGSLALHPNPDQFDIGSYGAKWSNLKKNKPKFCIRVDGLNLSDCQIKTSVLLSIQFCVVSTCVKDHSLDVITFKYSFVHSSI